MPFARRPASATFTSSQLSKLNPACRRGDRRSPAGGSGRRSPGRRTRAGRGNRRGCSDLPLVALGGADVFEVARRVVDRVRRLVHALEQIVLGLRPRDPRQGEVDPVSGRDHRLLELMYRRQLLPPHPEASIATERSTGEKAGAASRAVSGRSACRGAYRSGAIELRGAPTRCRVRRSRRG